MGWLGLLRWLLLLITVALAGLCLFGITRARAAAALLCGGTWFALSRWKVYSLDRETLGIPPRRSELKPGS